MLAENPDGENMCGGHLGACGVLEGKLCCFSWQEVSCVSLCSCRWYTEGFVLTICSLGCRQRCVLSACLHSLHGIRCFKAKTFVIQVLAGSLGLDGKLCATICETFLSNPSPWKSLVFFQVEYLVGSLESVGS